jgi:hypothetical protein
MTHDPTALEDALWHLCDDPPRRLLDELRKSRIPPLTRRQTVSKPRRRSRGSRPALLLLRLAAASMVRTDPSAPEALTLLRRMQGPPARGNINLKPLITFDGATLRITRAGRYAVAELLAADIMADLGHSTVNALETLALIVSETIRRRVWSGEIGAVVQARQELLPESR